MEEKTDNKYDLEDIYLLKRSLKIEFVCDECCLPLSLYGENVILHIENDRFITHLFCDLHFEEFLYKE